MTSKASSGPSPKFLHGGGREDSKASLMGIQEALPREQLQWADPAGSHVFRAAYANEPSPQHLLSLQFHPQDCPLSNRPLPPYFFSHLPNP
jgi:hypothetical protein